MHYERHELSNGLRVLVAPMTSVRSVSCILFVGVGSRWETAGKAGVAHLLEHLMFKGTVRRPTARAISETVEEVGGVINAATDKETTAYWTKTDASHLARSFDLISDMILQSRMTSQNVAKEKTVILEELGLSMDDPQDWVHGLLEDALWPDHPLGRDVAGTRESVSELTRADVVSLWRHHYGPNNALLTVAGAIDPAQVLVLARRCFEAWEPVRPPSYLPAPVWGRPSPRLEQRSTEQTHICLGFPGVSRFDSRRHAEDLLLTILGGSTTSYLFLELRERLAVAYDVHAYGSKVADTGAAVVYAGVDAIRVQQATKAILKQIERLTRRVVPETLLRRTVQYLSGRLALGLEDTHAVASFLGSQELLLGRIDGPEQVIASLEAVRPQEIRDLARATLRSDQVRVAAIGPNPEEAVAAFD